MEIPTPLKIMETFCKLCGSENIMPTGDERLMGFSNILYIEYICDDCGFIFWIIKDNDEDN
jgi:predicted RNA-binding Zn-ribbon protein involved in translation (DUF1610 family)